MPRQIPLVNSPAFALVDDADYAFLMQWQWRLNNKGYAVRSEVIAGKHVYFNMHRVILDAPRGRYVDHIDNNKLNNTRANLRLCTGSQNQANRRLHKNNTSNFKGITRRGNRWHARIEVNGKSIHLGYHDSAYQASLIYDHAARRYFGDFARLNHPSSPRMEAYEQRLDRILAGEQPKLPFVRPPAAPPVPKRRSTYRGVYWDKGRWRAVITVNGRKQHLGYFLDEAEAASAYQRVRDSIATDSKS